MKSFLQHIVPPIVSLSIVLVAMGCGNAPEVTSEFVAEAGINSSMLNYETTNDAETTAEETTEERPMYYPFSYDDVYAMAQMVYGEAQTSPTEQKFYVCVVALNHYDKFKEEGYTLYDIVTDKKQFNGFSAAHPVTDEIWNICIEAIWTYNAYKNQEDICWHDYYYFHSAGDGINNVFS